jgi:hypothetical protein
MLQRKANIKVVAAYAVAAFSVGCAATHPLPGFGGGDAAMQAAPTVFASGIALFRIVIPNAPSSDFVSPSTRSVVIDMTAPHSVHIATANLGPDARRCALSKSGKSICEISARVIAATDHFLVTTFGGPNGHGKTLAVAHATAEILPGKRIAVPLTLDGVIASVELELENPSPQPSRTAIPLIVSAKDSSGATIIGADDYDKPITLVDEDKSGATHLTTNRVVSPSTGVVLEYDGSPTLSKAVISAKVSGVPPGAITPAELVPSRYAPTPAPGASPTATSSPKVEPSSTYPSPTPTPTSLPTNGTHPLPASAFNNSVGINTHLSIPGNDSTNYAVWEPTLAAAPIKHMREEICVNTCSTWVSRIATLAGAGIEQDLVTNPAVGWSTNTTGCRDICQDGYAANLGIPNGVIEAYEGPNECDVNTSTECTEIGTTTGLTGVRVVQMWQPYYSQLASHGVAIFAPSVAFPANFAEFGSLASMEQYGVFHNYTNPDKPETGAVPGGSGNANCCGILNWFADSPSMNGSLPIVTTETGFADDTTNAPSGSVSSLTAESYLPRTLMWQLKNGIMRTYVYELADDSKVTGGGGYGLLTYTYAPKPVWTMLSNIMSYFQDTGGSPEAPLLYSVTGDTTGTLQTLLFQRSNGQYIVVPWLATLLWNSTAHSNIAPVKETLTLNVPVSVQSVQLTTFNTNGTIAMTTLSGGNGSFTLPTSSLIEAAAFYTSSPAPSLRKHPGSRSGLGRLP